MEAFLTHTGTIAVIPDDNIDTDRIIPARFLTLVSRMGYGDLLFHDVRGQGFPLDKPDAKGATVLVVGTNFGCGSSREHAVWAIQQAGFVAVIARKDPTSPGYSDIFRQNAANCGLLLAEVNTAYHAELSKFGSGMTVTIDLPSQTITVENDTIPFEINQVTKQALMAGLDLIGTTLQYETEIAEFEKKHESYICS